MSWIEPPPEHNEVSLAEFIEAELMLSDDDYLSLTEIRGLFASGRQPTADEIQFAFAEIERRGHEWGDKYPYLVDDDGVYLDRDGAAALYHTLLILSLKGMPVRKREEISRSDSVFDAISREAFKAWLTADAIAFGWPPRDGRFSDFKEALSQAAVQIGVAIRDEDDIPTHLKDAGVDVIVWRPFGDQRTGFEIHLVQNTVQWSFRKKAYDVRPLRWFSWLRVGAQPSVGFAVPFAMRKDDPWWDDVTDGVQIVMDRGRLLRALSAEDPRYWAEWTDLVELVQREIEAIKDPGPSPRPSVPKQRGMPKR